MGRRSVIPPEDREPRRPPATTPEARERQLTSLAIDLAERQLLDGTISSQNLNHYLKLATERERLEREKLAYENDLLQARAEQIASQARMEEVYAEALRAMRSYQGHDEEEEDDYYD